MSTCNCERCQPHLEAAREALEAIGVDMELVTRGADAAGMTVSAFMTEQLEGAARAVLDGRQGKEG